MSKIKLSGTQHSMQSPYGLGGSQAPLNLKKKINLYAAGPAAEEAAQLRRDLHNLTARRDRALGCRRRLLAEMERSIAKRDVISVKALLSRFWRSQLDK